MAQASQVTSLPEFTGEKITREQVLQFFTQVDRAKTTYGWDDEQTANAVLSRLRGHAAVFIQARTAAGVDMSTWPRLKAILQGAFARTQNANLAVKSLLGGLQQGPDEPIIYFYARVTLALDNLAFDKTAAQKAEQAYKDQLANQEFIFVRAGMRPSHRAKYEASNDAPANIDNLIIWIQKIEEGQASPPSQTVAEVHTSPAKPTPQEKPEQEPIIDKLPTTPAEFVEAVSKFMNRNNFNSSATRKPAAASRGRGTYGNNGNRETRSCHYCKKPGHLIKDCRARQRAEKERNGRKVNEVQTEDIYAYSDSLNDNGGQ
jgi:hypothetical protein